jgi:acyl-CoA thioesterase-1
MLRPDNLNFEKGREQGRMAGNLEVLRYVAVGDSTGAGVGSKVSRGYVARLYDRITRVYPRAALTNLCVSGATTTDLIRSQLQRAIDAKPSLVSIGIGINDVSHGLTPDRFAHNFEQIVSRILNETRATIVITNVPDISYAPAMPEFFREQVERQIVAFNAKISGIASRYKVRLVDSYGPTRELLPHHPEFFSEDGFHPSDEGYEYWAKVMWPVVKEAVSEVSG